MQKPHNKKSDVINTKVTARFLPSAVRNKPPLPVRPTMVLEGLVEVFILLTFHSENAVHPGIGNRLFLHIRTVWQPVGSLRAFQNDVCVLDRIAGTNQTDSLWYP